MFDHDNIIFFSAIFIWKLLEVDPTLKKLAYTVIKS